MTARGTQQNRRTFAIGDVHGEVRLLMHMLELLAIRPEDTLVFLGDCMDRGEDSLATIQMILRVKQRHRAVVCLRGNHEDSWLAHWNGKYFDGPSALDAGGGMWEKCGGRVPAVIGRWLETTRIDFEDAHAIYVHAGLLPGHPCSGTPDLLKMWGPKGFLDSDYDWGKPVIFGHWRLRQPLVQANKIGIDTGAYESGILTAVCLPDRQLYQVRRQFC